MKYMLMMNTPLDGYEQFASWPRHLLDANAAFMQAFTKKLVDTGELVGAEGLAAPEQAKRVRAGKDGKPITDGVFPESKEFLAGYWIVEVANEERALQLAAEVSTAPGQPVQRPDGSTIDHLWVEVRQVIGGREDLG
jgi:hypothetical protein